MFFEGVLFTLALCLVLSPLLIHELGHWAILRRQQVNVLEVWVGLGPVLFRYKKLRIGMLPIGAAVVPEPVSFERLSPLAKLWVAVAGPIASLAYGLVLLLVVWILPSARELDLQLLIPVAHLNFVLAAINILPIPPLDGFQAYKAWREYANRPLPSELTALASRLGNGFVYGIGFLALAKFMQA